MTLPFNNIEAVNNIEIDSVFLKYIYTDHYGDLNESGDFNVQVYELNKDLDNDNEYYSTYSPGYIDENLAIDQSISHPDSTSPCLKIQLEN